MFGLSSTPTDFAPTQPRFPVLGTAGLCYGSCACRTPRLFRIRRTLWMRIVVGLRLYQCAFCGCRVLRRPLQGTSAYSARAYMPRYERR